MRTSSLRSATVVAATLVTLAAVGSVASAATPTPTSSPTARRTASPTTRPTASASTSPSASSSSSGNTQCATAYAVDKPAGDSVGQLCTAVTYSSGSVSKVAVTFTASSSCTSTVDIRLSGLDTTGAEFADIDSVSCTSGTATASFTPASGAMSGTDVCGLLLAEDRYTAAQACVPVS